MVGVLVVGEFERLEGAGCKKINPHNQKETRLTEVPPRMAAGASASSTGSLNTGLGSSLAVLIERVSGEEAISMADGLVAVQAAKTSPERLFIVPATASVADMLSWVGALHSARALVGERERSGWPFTTRG